MNYIRYAAHGKQPEEQMGTYWWLVEASTMAILDLGVGLENHSWREPRLKKLVENQFFTSKSVASLFQQPPAFLELGLRAGGDLATGKRVDLRLDEMRYERQFVRLAYLIDEILKANASHIHFRDMVRERRLQAISIAWTGFEALCTDVWSLIIEAHGDAVLNALHADPPELPDGARRKKKLPSEAENVVNAIAAWGTGAKHLYRRFALIVGPEAQSTQSLEHWLTAFLAEKTRHIVVHRAGRADEKFVRETGSTIATGMPIDVDHETVYSALKRLGDLGLWIAIDVDRWISTRPGD